MSVLFMTCLGNDETLDKLRSLMPGEKISLYNGDGSRFVKLMTLSAHHFSLLLKERKIVNIFQAPARWIGAAKKVARERVINIYINHGWGTKKSLGNLESLDKSKVRAWRRLRENTDYVICNSDFDASYFMRHELLDDLPLPQFVPIGHPRNDFLVSNAYNVNLIRKEREKLGIPEGHKVILLAPTHRESHYLQKDDYDASLLNAYLSELEEIDQDLSASQTVLLFRPHYYFKDVGGRGFRNVKVVTSKVYPDPRPLMLIADVLITDYSSIYVDYLLLQRPIIFYQKDVAFFQEIRGLVVDPENPLHMPGPKIDRLSDILDVGERDFMKYDLNASRSFFHNHHDDRATERLANFLTEILARR